jgi:ABC-type lipoprotein release transport system permease subunit
LGVRDALFGDTAGGGRTSRTTMFAVGVAVAAAVAALGVTASISRLDRDPSLSGQATSRIIDSGESTQVYDRALPRLQQDPRVAMLAGVHVAFGITVDGEDVTAVAYDVRRGDIHASVLRGHIVRQPDEVALGPVTLEHLNKRVGQSIELHAENRRAVFRIVGSMLFPEGDFTYDEGVALTSTGADRLFGNIHDNAAIHQVAFAWNHMVDAIAADRSLAAIGLPVLTNVTALQPTPVKNLARVEALPRYLALFFGLLAVIMLANAILVTVRLRARELATLRALGITRRASSVIIATYTATVLLVALAVGIPTGLALERRIWTPIADKAHVIVATEPPWSAIVALLFAAVIVGTLVAAVPAWRARQVQPARTLRTE